jgi:hypothetical protein
MGPRTGLNNTEKWKFLALPELELRSLGSTDCATAVLILDTVGLHWIQLCVKVTKEEIHRNCVIYTISFSSLSSFSLISFIAQEHKQWKQGTPRFKALIVYLSRVTEHKADRCCVSWPNRHTFHVYNGVNTRIIKIKKTGIWKQPQVSSTSFSFQTYRKAISCVWAERALYFRKWCHAFSDQPRGLHLYLYCNYNSLQRCR